MTKCLGITPPHPGRAKPLAVLVFLACLIPADAQAQCRVGSGPDHGDGIPYCSELEPPPQQTPLPGRRWQPAAAALAWGDSMKGSAYVGVEHYVDEGMARDIVLSKCRERKISNCVVAVSVSNAVIAVGADSKRVLYYGTGPTKAQALAKLAAQCARHGEKCKVVKVLDGSPIYE